MTGPIDVVSHNYDGVLDEDLRTAALAALNIDRDACRATALSRSWERAAAQFLSHLVRCRDGGHLALDETAGAAAAGS